MTNTKTDTMNNVNYIKLFNKTNNKKIVLILANNYTKNYKLKSLNK